MSARPTALLHCPNAHINELDLLPSPLFYFSSLFLSLSLSLSLTVRPAPISTPQALAGSGGGDIGDGGGKNYGGGGGGNGGSGSSGGGADSSSSGGPFAALLAGWAARVAADPQFPYKVLVEQVIGVGAAVLGDMSSRPNWGLGELDFVFSTLVVGSILNFSLMYLLAPVAAAKGAAALSSSAAASSLIGRLASGAPLARAGAPVGHMFERGQFSLAARALNALYKGGVFAAVGFGAGVAGTTTSNCLLAVRERLGHPSPNRAPAVLANAGCWAAHMGVSSNLRYQALNGLDAALAPLLPGNVFKLWSVAVRCANNVAGGMSFVFLARLLGVQEAAASEAPSSGKSKGKKDATKKKDEKKKR